MSPSFLRNWRKKDRPQTFPTPGSVSAVEVPIPPRSSNSSPVSSRIISKRPPSDTPSESSARFFRIFKGSYTDTDVSSLASVDEMVQHTPVETPPRSPPFHSPPSSNEQISPLSSPHSLERPLPPLPPMRPTRPPSLDLNAIPLTPPPIRGTRRPPQRPLIPDLPRPARKMPELDNVWEGFIRDVEEDIDIDDLTIPPRRHGLSKDRPFASNTLWAGSQPDIQAVLDASFTRQPRRSVYHTGASGSTPYLTYPPELTSDSDSEYSNDETTESDATFPLALFPAPPTIRRRTTPKPLVLLPTPSIAPLPPSPSFSSIDSTPVATPTTSRFVQPPLYSARKGILKKPSASFSASSAKPTPPTTPTHARRSPQESSSASRIPSSPRLRSAQSVPYFQILTTSNTHRNTSSDTTSNGDRQPMSLHPSPRFRQQLYPKTPVSAPAPLDVQWGYAV